MTVKHWCLQSLIYFKCTQIWSGYIPSTFQYSLIFLFFYSFLKILLFVKNKNVRSNEALNSWLKNKLQSKLWRINGMTIFMYFKRPFVKRHTIIRPLYFILIFYFYAFHTYRTSFLRFHTFYLTPILYIIIFFNQRLGLFRTIFLFLTMLLKYNMNRLCH